MEKTPTLAETADEIALWFISEHTRLEVDGEAHRALVRRIKGALEDATAGTVRSMMEIAEDIEERR